MKQKIESEYMEFEADTRCAIALKEAAKILGLDEDALPVIKVDAGWLDHNLNWLENEKSKGLFVYNSHIAATKNHLIDVYPKVKSKLKKQFNKEMNKPFKGLAVTGFVNSAVLLELHHTLDELDGRPAVLKRETLH